MPSRVAPGIDRYFQLAVVLLLAHGFLTILLADQLDPLSALVMTAALAARALYALGWIRLNLPRWLSTVVALAFVGFYPLDIGYVSEDFVAVTMRLMFLFTAVKLMIAERGRDYFYLGVLAFLQLLAASMFVGGIEYLGALTLFLLLSICAYTSFEVRRCSAGRVRVVDDDRPRPRRRLMASLTSLSFGLSAGIVVISIGLFLVLPRVPGESPLSPLRGDYSVGFLNEVDLGLTGSLVPDHRPVLRVEVLSGGKIGPQLWRGVALPYFDGVRWSNPNPEMQIVPAGSDRYSLAAISRPLPAGRRIEYRVLLEPLPVGALFLAGQPEVISGSFRRLRVTNTDSYLIPDGGLRSVTYQVQSWISQSRPRHPPPVAEVFSSRFRQRYLQLPQLDPRVRELALRLAQSGTSPLEKAEVIEEHLSTEYGYTLDLPARRARDPLAHFLFTRREGHCEYFASAMAVMLRTIGIPSRLVNGFAGGIFNPISGQYVLRSSDAHSWVEAYLPGYGWLSFDPTPPGEETAWGGWAQPVWMYWDAVQAAWSEWVVDYDFGRQRALLHRAQSTSQGAIFDTISLLDGGAAWVSSAWRRVRASFSRNSSDGAGGWLGPLGLLAALPAVGFLLVRLWPRLLAMYRSRRIAAGFARPSDATFFYERSLRLLARRSFVRKDWQTSEEFAASIEPEPLQRFVAEIGDAYNAARFGNDPGAEQKLPKLVASLEEAR